MPMFDDHGKENENVSSIFVQIVVFSQPDHKKTMLFIKEGANLVKNTKKETNMKTIDNKTLYSNFAVLTSRSSMLKVPNNVCESNVQTNNAFIFAIIKSIMDSRGVRLTSLTVLCLNIVFTTRK